MKSKGKMKYRYDNKLAHVFASLISSPLDQVSDTKIGHVDMAGFLQRVEASLNWEMRCIKRSNIHLVSTFPMATLEPEFVLGCARHFSAKTKTIKDVDGNVIMSLDLEVIEQIFWVPQGVECVDLSNETSLNDKKWDY